ncbi:MAG: polysaccharide pyruvyl transferase family protein [Planctomycetota bacterium]|jgi:hypothetical protein|nr:polysaccharide pyruvyl transferase family protein [Planctomycetota bacterium]
MRYTRMVNAYRYKASKSSDDGLWNRVGNIGDCIQALAVENIYGKLGIADNELVHVNRDEIPDYGGEPCLLPMQAWFGNYSGVFPLPWSDHIKPVFIGFHLSVVGDTRKRFVAEGIDERMKRFEPIGCRDRNTAEFLHSRGIDAYFSGCLTLTFDARKSEPVDGKIFAVDISRRVRRVLPKSIVRQVDYSITHLYPFREYPVSDEEAADFEKTARIILERYRTEAKAVITSRYNAPRF